MPSSSILLGPTGHRHLILEACENAALASGFIRFEMAATLTGVPLYLARGYVALENLEVPLANGEALPIVRMEKRITKPLECSRVFTSQYNCRKPISPAIMPPFWRS